MILYYYKGIKVDCREIQPLRMGKRKPLQSCLFLCRG